MKMLKFFLAAIVLAAASGASAEHTNRIPDGPSWEIEVRECHRAVRQADVPAECGDVRLKVRVYPNETASLGKTIDITDDAGSHPTTTGLFVRADQRLRIEQRDPISIDKVDDGSRVRSVPRMQTIKDDLPARIEGGRPMVSVFRDDAGAQTRVVTVSEVKR
jgi:hypothetical protein